MTRTRRGIGDRMHCDIECDSDCECQGHVEGKEVFNGTTMARTSYCEAASGDDIWHNACELLRGPAFRAFAAAPVSPGIF
jgi:hypothetical protein